jgi:PIN domain nuclease of toxin-antitoxin system
VSLLLDTHVVLWWLIDSPDLPDDVKQRLDHEPAVYLSPVTVWEIAIKQSIAKLTEPENLAEIVVDAGFRHLAITAEHAVVAGRLPLLHRDPFDRMLIAQARCEGLTLVTRDPQIHRYDGVALLHV